MIIMAEDSVL